MGNTSLGSQVIPNFTFQSGHIPILGELRSGLSFYPLHSKLGILQFNYAEFSFVGIADFTFQSGHIPIKSTSPVGKGSRNFTFQSGHIPIHKGFHTYDPMHLYIPIWSYSNLKSAANAAKLLSFTFQSGHIPMHLNRFVISIDKSFTFQSGHIPINKLFNKADPVRTLHSNLVIFQFLPVKSSGHCRILYIPIWSYSNINEAYNAFTHLLSLHSNLVIFQYRYQYAIYKYF